SSKYSFVPTSRVINDLMTMKFKPFRAFQVNKRKGGHRYSKHQIHFRRDDLISSEEEFLEVILTNSHDGSAKFQLSIGIFVLVCSNGLVLPKQMFGELNIKHIGYSFQDLEHTLQQLIEHAPNVCKQIDVMKKRELTDEEKIKFAVSALKSRWDKEIKIN